MGGRRRGPVLKAPKGDFGKLLYSRRSFVATVYAMLAMQVAITALVATYLRTHQATNEIVHKYFFLWFAMSLVLIFALAFAPMHSALKFTILCVFSFVMGLNCIAASKAIPPDVIKVALIGTVGIFVAMSAVGLFLLSIGVTLNFLSYVLMAGLIGLLLAFIVTMFVPVSKTIHKVILACGLSLFSIFVAYDTNVMIQPDYDGDAINATVGLYLDILNIFTELVGFNGD